MDDNSLNPNEKISALHSISTTHRSLHDERRKSETQAFFTALTLYALIGAARFTNVAAIPNPLPCKMKTAAIAFIIAIAVASSVYLFAIHRSHQFNKKLAEDAEKEIRQILVDHGVKLLKIRPRGCFCRYLPCFCQIVIVLVFAAAAAASLAL